MDDGTSVKQNRLYLSMQEKDNLFPDQVSSIEKFCYTLQRQLFTLLVQGGNNVEKVREKSARRRGSYRIGRYAFVSCRASRESWKC